MNKGAWNLGSIKKFENPQMLLSGNKLLQPRITQRTKNLVDNTTEATVDTAQALAAGENVSQ